MVGLLIIPQQKWFEKLPKEMVSEDWGINPSDIVEMKSTSDTDEDKTVENVARHLRNSIAHYNFDVPRGISGKINRVKFEDFNRGKTQKTFEITMSVDNLRKFTDKLAEFALDEAKNSSMG